ncbi:hypothetical protein ACEPAF_7323 [Sanghuangporus sanghuang]
MSTPVFEQQPSHPPSKPATNHDTQKDAPRRSIQEITGKNNFIDAYRAAVKIKHNVELTDEELVCAITENWKDILKAKERGEFKQTDLDQVDTTYCTRLPANPTDIPLYDVVSQMKQFIEKKRQEIVKPAHASFEFWIEMLEGLLSAHRAFSRIEELLETFSLTKPQQFSRASTLFQTLSKLPRVPSPDWIDPTTKANEVTAKSSASESSNGAKENLTYIQMHHSFVYTSKGLVLFPEDVVDILSRDMKLFSHFNRDRKLNEKHIVRLRKIIAGFKLCEADKTAWKHRLKTKQQKMNEGSESMIEPPSFISISEAYHFVAKLAFFYKSHTGVEFEQISTKSNDDDMANNENQQSAQQPQAGATAPTAATTSQPGTTASTSTSSTTTTAAQNASAAAAASQKANANIIAALSSAFKTSTGESLQHDKIAQLLIANMDQISELARQGRLSQAQIEQLKQFATGNVPAPAASTSQQQSQAKPATQAAVTQAATTAPVPVMAPGTAATLSAATASGLKTSSPGPSSAATWTTNPESQYPISSTLNVTNPGPQPFPAATGRPTLSGGFAAGRVLSTPAQIARTDDNSVLSSDTSNRRKNTPNDQSTRRSIQDLVFSFDPNVKIEPDVEDLLLDIADEFIDSVTNFGCRLAKHRGGDTLEVRDLQLHLERNHNIRIPGFASDETRISISQSAIAPATGAAGPSSGKKDNNTALHHALTILSPSSSMSAEVTIAIGAAGRVLANIACAQNPRLGAGLVGLSNGFLIHRAWIAQTIFDPLTLLVLAAGLAFDHNMYGGFENTMTSLMACGLGIVLADFGPDLWYEFVGEEMTKEMARELEALGLGPFASAYDSSSDVEVDERSDVDAGSTVSRSSRRTSRSGTSRTGTSVTVRPRTRIHTHRPPPRPAPSTITRLSRVTFDESSITQSQSDDADVDVEDLETDPGTSTQLGLTTTNGDALSASGGGDDLYMEPSTTSVASSRTARPEPARRPSILRRLHIPGQEATTSTAGLTALRSVSGASSTLASSSHTRLTIDGETTPRATARPDFTPISPPSGFEPGPSFSPTVVAAPTFPEPDLSSTTSTATTSYEQYTPRIIPPSEPTPDLSTSIALPEPMYFPPLSEDPNISALESTEPTPISPERKHEDHHESGPSFFSQIMNVPIVPPSPSPEEQHNRNYENHEYQNGHVQSPESDRLDIPPALQAGPRTRSRSRSGSRTRSRSPAGPRPQPLPHYESLPPPEPAPAPPVNAYGPPEYISETYDDSTVDVRELTREDAIARIEEAWRHVEKRRHRRLNVRVRHDDDELQSSARKNSTFHLMEDLENRRFNFKIRPGIIIITSRSRG